MKLIKRFERDGYTVLTSENIKEALTNISFNSICFGHGLEMENYLFEETDYEHPFVIENQKGSLYINEDWYKDHLQEGIEFLKRILLSNKSETLDILSDSLIDDSLLDSIKEAGIVKKLELGLKYCLTVPVYEKLKDSSIEVLKTDRVEEELKDIFEPFLDYNWRRPLIDLETYEDLINAKSVSLSKEEELSYLHLLPLNCKLFISFSDEKILNKILEVNYPGPITIEVTDKKVFNQYLKEHPMEDRRVSINLGEETWELSLYKRLEEQLDNMVKGAEGLSPFEKYLYVYNVVKQYKAYKENEKDLLASRSLYQILQNEYMVCVGFSEMLVDLCARVGLPTFRSSLGVDVSYDKYDVGEEELEISKPLKKVGHARTHVYINDPKYQINGYYVADATWDNELEHDSYLFVATTVEERLAAKRLLLSDYLVGEEYFDCQSLEIFYAKVNKALDLLEPKKEEEISRYDLSKLGLKNVKNGKRIAQQIKREQTRIRNLKKIIDIIIEKLRILNPDYVSKLEKQYPCIYDIQQATFQTYYDVITDIGNHIVPMCNKQIRGADLFRAIKEVYIHSYGYKGGELSNRLIDTISYNKEAYNRQFPTRTMEYQDGHTDIYKNVPNKYDIPLPPGFYPKKAVESVLPPELTTQLGPEESSKTR